MIGLRGARPGAGTFLEPSRDHRFKRVHPPMKTQLTFALFVLLLGAGSPVVAAENPAVSPVAASPAAVAGKYVGTWKGSETAGGTLRIALKQESGGQWTSEAAFTFENTEVPTKTKSVKIDGTKVLLVFTWAIDGTPGESQLTGELVRDTLSGTYKTINETPSSGTWTVTRS